MMKMTTEEMANVYWRRMRGASLREVDGIAYYFRDSKNTKQYWDEVKAHLERKVNGL